MSSRDPAALLKQFRNRTLAELEHQHGRSVLERDEYQRRVGLARQARSPAELRPLLSDLVAETSDVGPSLPSPPAGNSPAAPYAAANRSIEPRRHVDTDHVVAVMSGSARKGHWEPAEAVRAVAIMGGVTLDFRDAAILEGTTDVTCFALMGGVKIILPTDVRVAVGGFGIMGGFGNAKRTDAGPGAPLAKPGAPLIKPGAPLIKIGGFAMWGGVEIHIRDADDEEDDAAR